MASQAHDHRYSLVTGSISERKKQVREADEKMLKSLKRTMFNNPLNVINNSIAYSGIKIKTLLEDYFPKHFGIETFTKPGSDEQKDPKDIEAAKELVAILES